MISDTAQTTTSWAWVAFRTSSSSGTLFFWNIETNVKVYAFAVRGWRSSPKKNQRASSFGTRASGDGCSCLHVVREVLMSQQASSALSALQEKLVQVWNFMRSASSVACSHANQGSRRAWKIARKESRGKRPSSRWCEICLWATNSRRDQRFSCRFVLPRELYWKQRCRYFAVVFCLAQQH